MIFYSVPLSFSISCVLTLTIKNLDLNLCSVSWFSKIWKRNCTWLKLLSCWQIHKLLKIIDGSVETCQMISICSWVWWKDKRLNDSITCASCNIILSISIQSFKLNDVSSTDQIRWARWTSWKIYVISVNLCSVFACISA